MERIRNLNDELEMILDSMKYNDTYAGNYYKELDAWRNRWEACQLSVKNLESLIEFMANPDLWMYTDDDFYTDHMDLLEKLLKETQ